jgi:hypothetical protein
MKLNLKLFSLLLVAMLINISAQAAFPVKKTNNQAKTNTEIIDQSNLDDHVAAPIETQAKGKSQLVALLLALFVGVLGIHRFYLGYTGIGLI